MKFVTKTSVFTEATTDRLRHKEKFRHEKAQKTEGRRQKTGVRRRTRDDGETAGYQDIGGLGHQDNEG